MNEQLQFEGLDVQAGWTNEKPSTRRRQVTITDDHGNRVIVVFSKKGRSVSVFINGIEFEISTSKMRKFADKGFWNAMDVLQDLGWTPGENP